MLNQVVLTGNLGADPEVFYSSEGNPVASFSLAFHSSKKKTGWIKVVTFQRLAEVTEKYLHKGARIDPGSEQVGNRRRTDKIQYAVDCKFIGVHQNRRKRI